MQLSDFVGQTISIVIPFFHPSTFQEVKLLGVEHGGIWIQSQSAINDALQKFGRPTAPKTMVFFFPYHAISLAISSIDEPALNETSFGV